MSWTRTDHLRCFSAADDATASSMLRSCLPSMGLVAMVSAYLLDVAACIEIGSRRALTRCAELGAALRATEPGPAANYREFLSLCAGRIAFTGVVLEVVQHLEEGFASGTLSLESIDGATSMRIDFQSENLVASQDGVPVVTVPDLINLIDLDTGLVLQSPDVIAGQQVHVVGEPGRSAVAHRRRAGAGGAPRVRHRPRVCAGGHMSGRRVGLAIGAARPPGWFSARTTRCVARAALPARG